jgi:hypothetical protein
MKILAHERGLIVAPVELEEGDEVEYVGHFTVDALIQFTEEIKKKYSPHRMVSIKRVFRHNSYSLVAVQDDEDPVETVHIGVAGCEHGRDGTE